MGSRDYDGPNWREHMNIALHDYYEREVDLWGFDLAPPLPRPTLRKNPNGHWHDCSGECCDKYRNPLP